MPSRGPRRRREKGPEKISEEITAENFPNMGKEIINQVQEAQSPRQDTNNVGLNGNRVTKCTLNGREKTNLFTSAFPISGTEEAFNKHF